MGRTFLAIDMTRAADLLGMDKRGAAADIRWGRRYRRFRPHLNRRHVLVCSRSLANPALSGILNS